MVISVLSRFWSVVPLLSISLPRAALAECYTIHLYLQAFSADSFSVDTVAIYVVHTLMNCNYDNTSTAPIPPGASSYVEVALFHVCEDLQDIVSPDWCVRVRVELICLFGVPCSHVL